MRPEWLVGTSNDTDDRRSGAPALQAALAHTFELRDPDLHVQNRGTVMSHVYNTLDFGYQTLLRRKDSIITSSVSRVSLESRLHIGKNPYRVGPPAAEYFFLKLISVA